MKSATIKDCKVLNYYINEIIFLFLFVILTYYHSMDKQQCVYNRNKTKAPSRLWKKKIVKDPNMVDRPCSDSVGREMVMADCVGSMISLKFGSSSNLFS